MLYLSDKREGYHRTDAYRGTIKSKDDWELELKSRKMFMAEINCPESLSDNILIDLMKCQSIFI